VDVASLRPFKNGQNSLNIQYSIENIQSLQNSENIPIQFFCMKSKDLTFKDLKPLAGAVTNASKNNLELRGIIFADITSIIIITPIPQ